MESVGDIATVTVHIKRSEKNRKRHFESTLHRNNLGCWL